MFTFYCYLSSEWVLSEHYAYLDLTLTEHFISQLSLCGKNIGNIYRISIFNLNIWDRTFGPYRPTLTKRIHTSRLYMLTKLAIDDKFHSVLILKYIFICFLCHIPADDSNRGDNGDCRGGKSICDDVTEFRDEWGYFGATGHFQGTLTKLSSNVSELNDWFKLLLVLVLVFQTSERTMKSN